MAIVGDLHIFKSHSENEQILFRTHSVLDDFDYWYLSKDNWRICLIQFSICLNINYKKN